MLNKHMKRYSAPLINREIKIRIIIRYHFCVWLFATPWTVAHQAPVSMGFSRQEYQSGLPFPPPRYFPDSAIEPGFDFWVRKILWRREWQHTPVFLPGESHGQRSLVGFSPWDGRVRHNWAQQHTPKPPKHWLKPRPKLLTLRQKCELQRLPW